MDAARRPRADHLPTVQNSVLERETEIKREGSGMNSTEQLVQRSLKEDGWTVLRNGWPDFLCIKDSEVIGVEVKPWRPLLSIQQHATHKALSVCGLKTFVYVCSRKAIEKRVPYSDIIFPTPRVKRKQVLFGSDSAEATQIVDVEMWKCFRCGHLWEKKSEEKPRRCAGCKSPYWDRPRKRK